MENALPPIPAKRYFTIGEVSELCGVKPYVLRYWEQEFSQLKPMKRRGNRRYYQHHEVLLIRRIRELLYDQGFTISGARNQLGDLLSPRGLADAEAAASDAPAQPQGSSPEETSAAPMAADAAAVATPGQAAQAPAQRQGAGSLAPGELRGALLSIRALLAV